MDVFISYASLVNMMSHGVKPDFEYHEEYPEWWAWWIKDQTHAFKSFYNDLIADLRSDNGINPLYIIRYEDLVMSKKETLMGLFSFLLGKPDLRGTNTERRI